MHAKTSRLPPVDTEKFTDEQAELAGGRGSPRSKLSIVRTLVHNPELYRSWQSFARHLISNNSLSPREREIVILHTAALCRGTYDVAHHRVIAQRAGLSTADIDAALNDGVGLAAFERTLMQAVEELVHVRCIADGTYTVLAERLTQQQLLDFVFTVGNYILMCMTTNTFGVQLEPDVDGGWQPN